MNGVLTLSKKEIDRFFFACFEKILFKKNAVFNQT